jgi:hypothetical protein
LAGIVNVKRLSQEDGMYKGLSYSPQYGSFGFGADPGPSDLENLIAGRERKLSDLVDQSVIERLLSGKEHTALPCHQKRAFQWRAHTMSC